MSEEHKLAGDEFVTEANFRRRRSKAWGGGRLKYYLDRGCPSCGSGDLCGFDGLVGDNQPMIIKCNICKDSFEAGSGMPYP